MSFQIPDHVQEIRERVRRFVEEKCYPAEPLVEERDDERGREVVRGLMREAKEQGLWALGHPKEIGGHGLPFLDYVYVNEVVGRSQLAMVALGTHSLQDSIMLHLYASPKWRGAYLKPLVEGEIFPSFGMTEPDVASSDPTQLKTTARLEDGHWVINGRKWFTSGADRAAYTTVMVRTEPDAPVHDAFSMIIVPTNTPGYNILRDVRVMGHAGGHCEVKYDNVRVPEENLLGPRGAGFKIAQKRLGPGRIFHCMRWLGQAQRAFDLMCERANSRVAFGSPLADKQLIQKFVFDSAAEIQGARMLTLCRRTQDRSGRRGARGDRADQGGGRVDAAQRDRPRHPGVRREGRHRGHAARADVPARPLRPHLRRPRRGAHHQHRAPHPLQLPPRRRLGLRPALGAS